MRVLIIVPCFNEQASLPHLIAALNIITLPKHYQLDIAVVNDCSLDKTRDVARQCNAQVIDLPVNLGIGGAVQSGLKYAQQNGYDIAIQVDGDGQHPPREIMKLINCHLQSGANLVIGSRFIEKEGFQSSFMRRVGISYFHMLNKIITGHSIYDSTSGFRLFDKEAIRLASTYYPDDYPEPESIVVFSKAGLRIKEIPVIMAERVGGKSSIRSFTSLYYCLKVTLAMCFSSVRSYQ